MIHMGLSEAWNKVKVKQQLRLNGNPTFPRGLYQESRLYSAFGNASNIPTRLDASWSIPLLLLKILKHAVSLIERLRGHKLVGVGVLQVWRPLLALRAWRLSALD